MYCTVRFFVRLSKNSAGILTYVKGFLGKMTEKMQARHVQSRQAVFVRCCLSTTAGKFCKVLQFSGGCVIIHRETALMTQSG